MFQSLVAGLLGVLMGALIAHALYLALLLFVALGPLTAMRIARRTENTWWIHVLFYSAALAAGMILFSDGRTVSPQDVRTPVSGAILTAVAGILSGLLRRPA